MGIQTALDAVRDADRIVDAMRLADELAFEASRDPGARTIRILTTAIDSDDDIVAIAATHALAAIFDEQADAALSRLLSSPRRFLREHVAWALSTRLPRADTIGRLLALVVEGGFSGMIAQRTLEQWSEAAPSQLVVACEGALLGILDDGPRSRLVETLGLVRHDVASRAVVAIAVDGTESLPVRAAAVAALGQRRGRPRIVEVLDTLAAQPGYLGEVAQLALVDLAAPVAPREHVGLTVAQLFLHADIDAGLTQAGRGDNGGIATLLVRLGDELVGVTDAQVTPVVSRVITLSRGSVAGALSDVRTVSESDRGHDFGRIPLLSEPVASANAWPLRVAARRGIRRMLRAGGVDLLHLRMADVGSLAAADVARELDIPVVFTVAPDPHAVIQSLDLSGRLTRRNFGETDLIEHFWFRTRLVKQLAANAAHTVLFPRQELERDMRELVGIDITQHPERHSIVPEGIDLVTVDRAVAAAADAAAGRAPTPAVRQLAELVASMPTERRGLPLLVSVGRFHRVKGMATIVEGWATSELSDRANLLLIGGDLDHPSADEAEQLSLMDALVPPAERLRRGLLMPGHQPNDTTAHWVAMARFGLPGFIAPRGVYVCGSVKEEFGIALLEAMGAGLLVVAPDGGGPATYVERGFTGFLARTWHVDELTTAISRALDLATSELDDTRPTASRATVEANFTIQAMAHALGDLYGRVRAEELVQRVPPEIVR